ncbi:MAG: aldehyde dehydrogenase family protein [Thermodesulfobacteriota bacterium]
MESGKYPGLRPCCAPFAAPGARAENEIEVCDKYTGEVIARVPLTGQAGAEKALSASASAAAPMAGLSAGKRSEILDRLAGLLEKHSDELARLVCSEAGKPIALARLEVSRALFTVRAAAAEALRFSGEQVPLDFLNGTGKTALTRRVPRGPVLCITPFNFPLNLAMHKVAPAIAAGLPFMVKPSPLAPLSALCLTGLCREAGVPEAAAQAFLCENDVTARICADPRVAMLSFTGSDAVGWRLRELSGRKKVCLELGGNAALVVDETADLAAAARIAAQGSFVYAGQVCISTQRIYAVKEIYPRFAELLARETESFPTGDPRDESVLCGPVINAPNRDRLSGLVRTACEGGAGVLARAGFEDPSRNILAPAILTNVPPSHPLCRDEAFGPVALLAEASDFGHALALANDTRYGLQAGVFTNLIARMKQAHETLNVGAVIIGNAAGFRVDTMPYGGVKDSGRGREGVRYAMEEMTEPRLLVY